MHQGQRFFFSFSFLYLLILLILRFFFFLYLKILYRFSFPKCLTFLHTELVAGGSVLIERFVWNLPDKKLKIEQKNRPQKTIHRVFFFVDFRVILTSRGGGGTRLMS